MKRNKRIYRSKPNFNFFKKRKIHKITKTNVINKILKSKRLSGLFKRKFNMRTTILKKRSLIFFRLEKKKKKKFKNFKRFRFTNSYRIININLYNSIKSTFYENRRIFNFFFKKKNSKRQGRFNKYIINILNKNSKDLINHFEYKLPTVLVKSHFFNNINDACYFIKKGYILINNKVIFNIEHIINFKDKIRMITPFNYYFFYRKNLDRSLKMSKKINWAFYKFIKKNKFNFFFPKVYRWINNSRYFGFDIPFNMEVDFVNMTLIILSKSFDLNNIDHTNLKYINFYLIRLYNWSYVV
jgi:hypothetical protein